VSSGSGFAKSVPVISAANSGCSRFIVKLVLTPAAMGFLRDPQ
jgi:hypothetical protein